MEKDYFLWRIQDLEAQLSWTASEKDQALELPCSQEREKNKAIQSAKVQEKEKCIHILTHSHSRFSRLNEISSCEAFQLGWELALLDSAACIFSSPDAFDAANQVEVNNYELECYISKENLEVDFVKELNDEEASALEGDIQGPHSKSEGYPKKDQVESHSPIAYGANPSKLEGCLNVVSGIIEFSSPLLESLTVSNLQFID